MKIPKGLKSLLDDGLIDSVVRQLQSGKEATVYIVASDDEHYCAKVYKDAKRRSFKKAADYSEGRKTRNSRNARAAGRRSNYGRKVQEEEWKNAEIDALYRLYDAGVRVPTPHSVNHGVLIMELILDEDGDTAQRLSEVNMSREEALDWHAFMMSQIVKMLCADMIHGDLSEYNLLLGVDGPVVIDLPQAVAATGNNHAYRLLSRDVRNMEASFARAAPELKGTQYARELWELYETGKLKPDTVLTGVHVRKESRADVDAVLDRIEEARLEAEERERMRRDGEEFDEEEFYF